MASSSEDMQALRYARGTLEYRKQRNRKRTSTGEFVWSDEEDIVFALALIIWTSDRSYRIGTRRSIFLQQFLSSRGFTKTRKQIASRLQVLKGEWNNSPYLHLLREPDDSEDPHSRRGSSPLSSTEEPPASSYVSSTAFTLPKPSLDLQDTPQNYASSSALTGFSRENSTSLGATPPYSPRQAGVDQKYYTFDQSSVGGSTRESFSNISRLPPQAVHYDTLLPATMPFPIRGIERDLGLAYSQGHINQSLAPYNCPTSEEDFQDRPDSSPYPDPPGYPFSY
ncbi:hypothetical protein K439DRAFT_1611781 [Ramaria rubella]|nr:hypothetical protein K439DRAFT_1611781 [Ramaria rubella]